MVRICTPCFHPSHIHPLPLSYQQEAALREDRKRREALREEERKQEEEIERVRKQQEVSRQFAWRTSFKL